MQTMMLSLLVCLMVVLAGGCTGIRPGAAHPIAPTTRPPVTVAKTADPAPSAARIKSNSTDTLTTTGIPAGPPLSSPVTLTGGGRNILRFDIASPGPVTFQIRYSPYLGKEDLDCTTDTASLTLGGGTVEKVLVSVNALKQFNGTRTVVLPSAGEYTLTTQGCWTWKVVISNA